MPMIDRPTNPYAERDFAHTMKEASEDLSKGFKNFSGVMRLKHEGTLHLSDLFDVLLENGYEVTMRLEDATETERKLDGADKFVVIEYKEVE